MSFLYPWVLLLAFLPVAWVILEWRGSEQRSSLVMKALTALAVILALAQPSVDVNETKLAVAVLVDTSAGLGDADLDRGSAFAAALQKERGRNTVRILPFAGGIRNLEPSEVADGKLRRTPGAAGRRTDIEAAIREATVSFPTDQVPRVVLISDGRENRGSVARAAWQARQLGVAIDTYALAGRPEPKLRLRSVQLPAIAFVGERFPLELSVDSPIKTTGSVELSAEGKGIGSTPVTLEPGLNNLRVNTTLSSPGALDLSAVIRTADQGEVRFEQAIHLRKPKLLYLTQDPAGMESHLFQVFTAAQFQVSSNIDITRARFDDYQLVVFNNYDLESLTPARKADLERFTKQGGGVMVIGGERNLYVEKKPGANDPLDRMLPATVAPPRSPEGTVVVLIVDKSSSMEGRKMELARIAAIGVVENLRPIDQVGVLIFDNTFQWAVPIRRAIDKTLIKRLVAGITPDGGTQIAPALTEAYKRIVPTQGTYKHVVLLTDGISEEGDSMSLAKEAALQKVTISTVGLGQDVNRAYLEKVAVFARGKSYFLTDPSGLEQILLKDVLEHTGSTTVEKSMPPQIVKRVEVLDGVPMEAAPALKGYVRFVAKPTADTILKIDAEEPLYTRWQYGLGRAAVFTSDAKSRWADAWVTWAGFDPFWENVLRDLLPHAQAAESKLTYDGANGDLLVEYRLAAAVVAPERAPAIFAFGPDGFQSPVELKRSGASVWTGRVKIGDRQGLFRVRPLVESAAFPEIGLYRPETEMESYGSNEALLRQVSKYTGGKFNPAANEVFRPAGAALSTRLRLWPALIVLAVLLNLAELLRRKGSTAWSALREIWQRRFGGGQAAEA